MKYGRNHYKEFKEFKNACQKLKGRGIVLRSQTGNLEYGWFENGLLIEGCKILPNFDFFQGNFELRETI